MDILCVAIVWIGHSLHGDLYKDKHIMKELNMVMPQVSPDGSQYQPDFALTHTGELVNLTEYATHVASNKSTQILLILDY